MRAAGPGLTPRAIELFREGLPLVAGRIACIESDDACTHDSCDRYREIASALDRELGLRPWIPSPLDERGRSLIAHPDPADGYETWKRLRAALLEAIGHESA